MPIDSASLVLATRPDVVLKFALLVLLLVAIVVVLAIQALGERRRGRRRD